MKTNILKKYSLLLCTGMLMISACTKNFEDINTNPSAYGAATFDPNYTLTTAQLTYRQYRFRLRYLEGKFNLFFYHDAGTFYCGKLLGG